METVKPWCDPDIETSFEHNGEKRQYSQKVTSAKTHFIRFSAMSIINNDFICHN